MQNVGRLNLEWNAHSRAILYQQRNVYSQGIELRTESPFLRIQNVYDFVDSQILRE